MLTKIISGGQTGADQVALSVAVRLGLKTGGYAPLRYMTEDGPDPTLARYGLEAKVHLHVADSRTVEPPPEPLELLFIDGDHSYEGARADFEGFRFPRDLTHEIILMLLFASPYSFLFPPPPFPEVMAIVCARARRAIARNPLA